MEQMIYVLTEVENEFRVKGSFRQANAMDKKIVSDWAVHFHRGVFGEEPDMDRIEKISGRRVDQGEVYLWCDEEIVSMCGKSRPTEHGITINYVYTPPDKRGKG